jgi:hypothetical protein
MTQRKLFVDAPAWWFTRLRRRAKELNQAKDPAQAQIDAETEREEDQPFQGPVGPLKILRDFDQALDNHMRSVVAPSN